MNFRQFLRSLELWFFLSRERRLRLSFGLAKKQKLKKGVWLFLLFCYWMNMKSMLAIRIITNQQKPDLICRHYGKLKRLPHLTSSNSQWPIQFVTPEWFYQESIFRNARFRLHLSSNVFIGETSRNDRKVVVIPKWFNQVSSCLYQERKYSTFQYHL